MTVVSARARMDDRLSRLSERFSDSSERRSVLRRYAERFRPNGTVLDVGCGRGEFLDILRESGIDGLGIESVAGSAEACQARGHEVLIGDAVDVVQSLDRDSRDIAGAMVAHVLEHLQPPRALEMLDALFAVVSPSGRAVVVTPNTKNLVSITEFFWLDPTHVRPYPRALVEELGRDSGWTVVESFEDPATVPRRAPWKRALASLRSTWSGADRSSPLDSVVVFEKPTQ